MLEQKQILSYAIKGVYSDIAKIERSIKNGKRLLEAKENGTAPYSDKTPSEIQQMIQTKKAEVDYLTVQVLKLKWQLSELEEQEK